tara:strand:+ start:6506 stop:7861 length:1356 start_codon:yes stop_codon:yes gene_type:complete
MKKLAFFLILFISIQLNSFSQFTIGNTQLDTVVLATNLSTPWEILYTSDSSLWFTERIGKVSRIDLATGITHTMLDYQNEVEAVGESGMLGMAIIETTAIPRVLLAYTYLDSNSTFFERLERFIYDPIQDTLLSELILIDSIPAARGHIGSRLLFLNNQIYMTTGDANNTTLSQNLNTLAGKVLRVNFNGSIPIDNPISGSPIYSWGHRNPQGLVFANNFLYSSEHGPTTDDELNIIVKGRNYGWPNVNGFCNTPSEITFCNDSNVVEPIIAWTPTVATSQLIYYDHSSIPEWQGSLLMTTLKDSKLIEIELSASKDSVTGTNDFFTNTFGRLRSITTNQYGEIFIATNSSPQRIIKFYNPNLTTIKEIKNEAFKLSIGPNPVINKLLIQSNQPLNEALVDLYTISGQLVHSASYSGNLYEISVANYTKGLYFVRVSDKNGLQEVRKIIVE